MTFGSYWATLPIELHSIYALLCCISFNLLYCKLITRTFKKLLENCKDYCAEANVKTENREKECAGLMGAWSHAQYAGERERE